MWTAMVLMIPVSYKIAIWATQHSPITEQKGSSSKDNVRYDGGVNVDDLGDVDYNAYSDFGKKIDQYIENGNSNDIHAIEEFIKNNNRLLMLADSLDNTFITRTLNDVIKSMHGVQLKKEDAAPDVLSRDPEVTIINENYSRILKNHELIIKKLLQYGAKTYFFVRNIDNTTSPVIYLEQINLDNGFHNEADSALFSILLNHNDALEQWIDLYEQWRKDIYFYPKTSSLIRQSPMAKLLKSLEHFPDRPGNEFTNKLLVVFNQLAQSNQSKYVLYISEYKDLVNNKLLSRLNKFIVQSQGVSVEPETARLYLEFTKNIVTSPIASIGSLLNTQKELHQTLLLHPNNTYIQQAVNIVDDAVAHKRDATSYLIDATLHEAVKEKSLSPIHYVPKALTDQIITRLTTGIAPARGQVSDHQSRKRAKNSPVLQEEEQFERSANEPPEEQ